MISRTRLGWALFSVLIGALVVGFVVMGIVTAATVSAIRESQLTNRKLAVDNAKVLDRINDCTTPGRKCFDDGQKRSASVISTLNQGAAAAAAAAAACADRPGISGYREIKACVDRTLADQRR